MDDCGKDGDYCKFHRRFLALFQTLESKPWFSNFEIKGEFNFEFEDGEFVKSPKMAQYFQIEFMRNIIIQQIRDMEKNESPDLADKPTRLLEKLESFDYDQEFGEEINDNDEDGEGNGNGNGPPPPGGRRKKRDTKAGSPRRKREGPGGGPGGPGGGPGGPGGGPGGHHHKQEVISL